MQSHQVHVACVVLLEEHCMLWASLHQRSMIYTSFKFNFCERPFSIEALLKFLNLDSQSLAAVSLQVARVDFNQLLLL